MTDFSKKYFSDLAISKRFLEDFLGIQIETIERLSEKNKITDDAAFVEFDFRCKINSHYVIIDMQQWYKSFVVKRFYLYQSLNSALELENLPKRDLPVIDGRKVDTRVYNHLLPTITLIWMSDDCLGFDEDYIAFALFPEQTADFFKNDALWDANDLEKMSIERQKILTLLNNNTKNLDFLPQNRLIYAFQRNIVKNKKLTKYFQWFELAEKTRNKNNTEQDFITYKNDETLMAVIERIKKSTFDNEELSALEALERELALSALWRLDAKDDLRGEVKQEVKEEIREEVTQEVREELTPKLREELTPKLKEELTPKLKEELTPKLKEELTPKLKEEVTHDIVISAFLKGLDVELIASITNLSVEKVNEIINDHKNN